MNTNSYRLALLVIAVAMAVPVTAQASTQDQAAGGKLPPAAGPVTTAKKPVTKAAPKRTGIKSKPIDSTNAASTNSTSNRATRASRTTALVPGSIDGKWWTTGNGFGDSEVLFTQNGPRVSGVIRYADGRTGVVDGVLVGKRLQHSWTNSNGDGGTGWLELSWNNFLGGPWRNQRVKDGSWTLSRIEGKWCFGGSRNRIRTVTHDARGRIRSVTEDRSQDDGRLEGPRMFLDSDFGSIEGTMNFKSNRVEWSSGFFWTWCGR